MKFVINPDMKIFLDSSVLISVMISSTGGSAKVLELCEGGFLNGYISDDVVQEVTRVIDRKLPELKRDFLKLIKVTKLSVLKKIPGAIKKQAALWISDPKDVDILAAAKHLEVDFLLTLDIRHFITDVSVAKKSGLRILTPAEFLRVVV